MASPPTSYTPYSPPPIYFSDLKVQPRQLSFLPSSPLAAEPPQCFELFTGRVDLDYDYDQYDNMVDLSTRRNTGKLPSTHAEAAAQVINTADMLMREQVRRGSGDAAPATLYACLLDQTKEHSGQRDLFVKAWSYLNEAVAAAAKGEFSARPYPDDFVELVTSGFTAEEHRLQHLQEKLDFYLHPPSKLVKLYHRDRNAGQLIEYVSSSSTAGLNPAYDQQQLETVTTTAAARLDQQMTSLTAALDKLTNNLPEMPMPPKRTRPSKNLLNDLNQVIQNLQGELYEYGKQHIHYAPVRKAVNAALPPAVKLPPAPAAAASDTPTKYSDAERDACLARVAELVQTRTTAMDQHLEGTAREVEWLEYATLHESYLLVSAEAMKLEDRLYELEQRKRALLTPSAAAVQQSLAVKPSLVQGYHHDQLGFVVTPSLAIYYIMRATYEAVYQLAGKLDAEGYRRLRQQKGQDLRSWGSHVQAMAASFPNLRDDEHRAVYQEGLSDPQLKRELKQHRRQNPDKGNNLASLIQLTQSMADREVELLSETVESAQTSAADKQAAGKRLNELLVLMGHGTAAHLHLSSIDDGAGADGTTKVPSKEALKLKRSDFRTAQAFNAYCGANCVIHSTAKVKHTNRQCSLQRDQLDKLHGSFYHPVTGMVGQLEHDSEATPQQQQPYWPPPMGPPAMLGYHHGYGPHMGYGYAGSDWSMPTYGAPSTLPAPSMAHTEMGMAANTIKDERQRGLLNPGNRQQPRRPGWGGRPPAAAAAAGNLPMPPPDKRYQNCEHCGWKTTHFPYVCSYKFPHLASPSFNQPTENTRPELKQMYAEGVRLMPPGMPLGGLLPEWLDRHRQLLGGHAERIQRDIAKMASNPQAPALVAVEEYAGMALGCAAAVGDDDDPDQTWTALQKLYGKALYPDLTPAQKGHSSSSSSNCEPHIEYAAAFPMGFLQKEKPPASTPAASQPVATRPLAPKPPAEQQQTITPKQMQQMADHLMLCLNMLRNPAGQAPRQAPPESAAYAAAASSGSLATKHVNFVDEMEAKQQQSYEASKPGMVEQLKELIRTHGVKPGQPNSAGLRAINTKLRGGKRFTLDRFINDSPQTGYSLLLANGSSVQCNTKSDTGCSQTLADRRFVDRVGIRHYPTSVKLRLADSTLGNVVGITEPFYGVVAAGTEHQGSAILQALVIENAAPVFELLTAKDHHHDLDAWVMPRDQLFSYRTDAGHRHTVPVECYYTTETGAAGAVQHQVLPGSYALANPDDLPKVLADFWDSYNSQEDDGSGLELAGCSTARNPAKDINPQLVDYTSLPTEYAFMGMSILLDDTDTCSSSDSPTAANGQTSIVCCCSTTAATEGTSGESEPELEAESGAECEPQDEFKHNILTEYEYELADEFEYKLRAEYEYEYEARAELVAESEGELLTLALLSDSSGQVEVTLFYDCCDSATPVTQDLNEPAVPEITCFIAATDLASGGVQLELYYNLELPYQPPAAIGRAAYLAAAVGCAGSQHPKPSPATTVPVKRYTAGTVLRDAGYEAPPLYFRATAYLATWAVTLLMVFLSLLEATASAVGPIDAYAFRYHLERFMGKLQRWWLRVSAPVPDFKPPLPAPTRRSRKKARHFWMLDWFAYMNKGKTLTGSLRRHAKRFLTERTRHDKAEHVHFVCTLGFGIGSKGLLPLMLLAITSVLATTLAAPDLINGLHGMTNNLAAWELSHLAGWRFLRGRLLQWYSRTAVWYPYRPRSRRTASSAIRSYRRYRWSLS